MVDMPKINTIYHGHTLKAANHMVVVDSVGFGYTYLSMHAWMSNIIQEVHSTPIQLWELAKFKLINK